MAGSLVRVCLVVGDLNLRGRLGRVGVDGWGFPDGEWA